MFGNGHVAKSANAFDSKSNSARSGSSSLSVSTKENIKMIKPHSICVRNLKVGDSVVVKLLPYNPRYQTFNESFTFPIIGFTRDKVPLIGTMRKDLYENHNFITTGAFYGPPMNKWKYCMALTARNISNRKIIKGGARSNTLIRHMFKGKKINPGDTILARGYGQYLRVDSCRYLGSWTLKPIIECIYPGYGAGPIKKTIYVEDIIEHREKKNQIDG